VSGLKYNSGKTSSIGQATIVDKATIDPALYEGTIIYGTDKQIYFSNGSTWNIFAKSDFSYSANNSSYAYGKQESQLSVANAVYAQTANNSTYAYGKEEKNLSVNSAVFAVNSNFSYTANNSSYAYGKQESQLSVANAVYAQTANNSTYAYGKQETQLSVANAVYAQTANNSTYAYGKQESQLSVNSANNSSYLLGRTWTSPGDIGTSSSSNGIFNDLKVLNNLYVNGSLTYVNTSVTTTNNTFIILNDYQQTPFNDVGFIFQRYKPLLNQNDYNIALYWDEASKKLIIGTANTVVYTDTQNVNIKTAFLTASENGDITIDGRLISNTATINTATVNTATVNRLTINAVTANGSIGNYRQVLASNGNSGTFWTSLDSPVIIASDNTSSTKYYLPMSNATSGAWTNAVISDARLSFIPSTGTLTANQGAFTDSFVSSNSYINKLVANGSIGGLGQVLLSNGAGIYWENSLVIALGAGYGLSSNNTHYQVNANTGIIANTSGTFVNSAYIATITANNSTYAYGKEEKNLSVNSAVFAVNSNFSYTANVANYANAAINSNNSSYLLGYTWSSPPEIGSTTANTSRFSNTTVDKAHISSLSANGSFGQSGQVLTSNGTGVYWTSNILGAGLVLAQNNTSTSTWYLPMTNAISGTWSNAVVSDNKLSFVPSTGTLTTSAANITKASIANAAITSIFANNSSGSSGQILASNGSGGIYWSADNNTTYDLKTVANTYVNLGILRLTSSTSVDDDVYFTGVGTTVVRSDSGQIYIETQDQYVGTVTSISSGNGLFGSDITTSGTLNVGAGYGISVNSDYVSVNANNGLVANSTGLWVNTDFIKEISKVSSVSNADKLNSKEEKDLNVNNAIYANSTTYFGGKTVADWANTALGNTSADYTWTGKNTFNRSIFMGNTTSSYIEWNDAGLGAPSASASWSTGTKLALWEKTGTSDVGYGIGIESNAIWYSANSTSSSHKWYANNNTVMVANTTGLFVNGQIYGTLNTTVLNANNSANLNGKKEAELYVANAVYATTAGTVANATFATTANNSYNLNGKKEAELYVANAVYATTANNSYYLNGKPESQLSVKKADTADSVPSSGIDGTVSSANNSANLNGKKEAELSVANAVYATTAGSTLTANNSANLNGKKEAELYVANAVYATTAGSVANATFATTANNSYNLNGKPESQLSVNTALGANNSANLNGKKEAELYVANAVYATTAGSILSSGISGTVLSANNSANLNGKKEAELYVANAVYATTAGSATTANNSANLNGKKESELYVANAVYATTAGSILSSGISGTVSSANNSANLNGKKEAELSVANAALLNSQNSAYYTNATNLNAGLVPTARLASGTADPTTYLRGDQTWAAISSPTTWGSNITWTGGVGVFIAGESSFDLQEGGTFGVIDTGVSQYAIKAPYGLQVQIGEAGTRGLYVYGAITATGNITAYSDEKIKKNVKVIPNALDKVSRIRGVTFERTDIESDKRYTGVIAQEIEAVLPEVVQEDSKGIKTVAYGNIVGLLIEAIKELKAEIEELKSK